LIEVENPSQETKMPAYAVFIRESTRDQSELDAYTPKAAASLEGHTVKVLAA
jgi:hypothetical protein